MTNTELPDPGAWLEGVGRWLIIGSMAGMLLFAAALIGALAGIGITHGPGSYDGLPGRVELWVPLVGLALFGLDKTAHRAAGIRRGEGDEGPGA
jgi:hypothetical protein